MSVIPDMSDISSALLRRLALDLVSMLETAVSDAGYCGHADGGVPLMVATTATVLGAMLKEDGAVAVATANAALQACGSPYRLVLVT